MCIRIYLWYLITKFAHMNDHWKAYDEIFHMILFFFQHMNGTTELIYVLKVNTRASTDTADNTNAIKKDQRSRVFYVLQYSVLRI